MKLHKEAFPSLFFATVIFILSNLAVWRLLNDYSVLHQIYFYTSLVLLALTFYFFRVPEKVDPINPNLLISPAHGKIVEIVDEDEMNYFKGKRKRVSIFMSPLNIHCNYSPIAGDVKSMDYFPGKYLVAFHPKSSELNEHTFTVIENDQIAVGVKQIAGFMARRIVPYFQTGQAVQQNDELGFIKFGSRVDLFLPIDIDLQVKIGDKVKGAKTVLAEIK